MGFTSEPYIGIEIEQPAVVPLVAPALEPVPALPDPDLVPAG